MYSVTLAVENELPGTPMGTYQTSITPRTNVYDTMVKLEKENSGKFSFKAIGGEYGHFITEINGLEQSHDKSNYWMYYVNGVLASVDVDSYQPKNGDKITWKYEHYNIIRLIGYAIMYSSWTIIMPGNAKRI